MSIKIQKWTKTNSGELCEYITSGSRDWKSYYSDQGALFIRTQDINKDRLELSVAAFVALPEKVEGKRSRLSPGDLLVTITGANVGKVAIVPDDIPEAYVSQSVGLMRLRDKRNGPFLHYYLQSDQTGRKHLLKLVYGIGRPVLSLQDLRAVPVWLPPVAEQRAIVAEIEKQFTRLDAGVAALRRVQANLKRYRAAVLKAACEGRLVPTEAELAQREGRECETGEELLGRILKERREKWKGRGKYKEPVEAKITENLPFLPKGWIWASADQISSQITDGEHIQPRYASAGFPMLSAKHVRSGFVEFTDVPLIAEKDFQLCLKRCAPARDDILIVCVGATTGRAAIVGDTKPFAVVRSVLLIRPLMAPLFLLAWIQSTWCQTWIQRASGASAQPHFYINNAKDMCVPIPPLAEQTRVVAEVERRLSVVDGLEATVKANLQRAARLRQAVLQRAFEGRLT